MSGKDHITSLLWLIVALSVGAWSVATMDLGTLRHPGPGFLPVVSSVTLGALAVVLFLQSRGGGKSHRGPRAGPRRTVIVMLVLLLAYGIGVEHAGFLLATFLLMLLVIVYVARGSLLTGFVESSLATAGAYLLFKYFLKVPLPKGWFGF